jgi:hypothetical protein
MWKRIKKLFGIEVDEFPQSKAHEFLTLQSKALIELPELWRAPWAFASEQALKLLALSIEELTALEQNTPLDLPAHLNEFNAIIEHGAWMNGTQSIAVIVSSDTLVAGKDSIRAYFELSFEREISVQPRPLWSGPNSESLAYWPYGYEPE